MSGVAELDHRLEALHARTAETPLFNPVFQLGLELSRRLESGEAPLDESIDLYARGEALRTHCQARLDAAQARIEAVVADREGRPAATRPFDGA